ncbi:ABC transporter ATP-binding protein [Nitriliruptor alkaliphilus]|uniref:ABC transporter ATP-binding protein n=1 Tax=Nitriliruptor alkaliphilus TaxID=427918 RepID=UPI00069858E0|nr:ABC transporter ATP-binding protein [Nitriliruptor alkaliphilus]
MTGPLLTVSDLTVDLRVDGQPKRVLEDVSFSVAEGEAMGLVGESGSGKSMTARALLRLLPRGASVTGSVRCGDREVLSLGREELRRYRSRDVAMIFQDPQAHINPVHRIGSFLIEPSVQSGVPRSEATARASRLLDDVGISEPQVRMHQYPHELSGGMLQRVMIAAALMHEPRLLLADEPTTALDVTTQSEVMAILDDLRQERGLSLVFITHDLDIAVAVCQRITVLYAGSVLESRPAIALHDDPAHPYSSALIRCRPPLERRLDRLPSVSGRPVSAFEAGSGCVFGERCEHAETRCHDERPPLEHLADGVVRCHRHGDLAGLLQPIQRWVP